MAVQRWTDEMLDNLASSTIELRNSITEFRQEMAEMRANSAAEMAEMRANSAAEMAEMRASVAEEMAELRESIAEIRDSVDGLRITSQALLQVAAQSQRDMEAIKERQAESDQRFNVLLEEVRFLIRGNNNNA